MYDAHSVSLYVERLVRPYSDAPRVSRGHRESRGRLRLDRSPFLATVVRDAYTERSRVVGDDLHDRANDTASRRDDRVTNCECHIHLPSHRRNLSHQSDSVQLSFVPNWGDGALTLPPVTT